MRIIAYSDAARLRAVGENLAAGQFELLSRRYLDKLGGTKTDDAKTAALKEEITELRRQNARLQRKIRDIARAVHGFEVRGAMTEQGLLRG